MDATFVSLRGHALRAQTLLGFGAVVDVLLLLQTLNEIRLLKAITSTYDGPPSGMEDALALSDLLGLVLGVGSIGVFIATAIAFIIWFHRAYKNLPALGWEYPAHTPGWAIGAWFVPFLNLVRPYQLAKEMWDTSVPSRSDAEVERGSGPVGLWWGLWIAGGVTGNISTRLTLNAEDASELILADYAGIANNLIGIAAAAAAIALVRGITARQEQRYLEQRDAAVAAAPEVREL